MDQTEFTKKLDISTVTNFQSIDNYMPDQDDRLVNDTMPLGEAVMEVVGELQEYHPGTLLVVAAMHTLAQDQADFVDTEALLKKKIKLLVFSPNELETIAPLLPTLQDSGGNFYAGSRAVSSEALKSDMDSYLEAHTIDDHYLYGVSRFSVAVGKNTSLPVVILDNTRSKQVNARVTIANFAEDSIEMYLVNPMYGKPILCGRPTSTNEMECYHENIDSGVFVHFPTMTTPDPAAEYKVLLKNTGSTTVEGDVTWSVVSMDVSSPQIVVDVWSSEDAGVKAGIPESNNLILFCQISHVSGVLEYITVQAKVELNNGTDTVERLLTMLDDGPGDVDVRARDTVWSAQVEGDWPPGTTLTVTELAINNKPQNFSPFASISSSLERKVRAGESGGVGGSGVMPIDPTKGYCCGSYSNAAKSRITEVNMYLLRPYSITFTHHIQELPVRIKELKLAPEPPVMKGDTWEVSITWTRNVTTTDSTDSIWIRYGLTISAVGDNFLSASAPLNGSDQVSAVSKRCVAILPNTGDDVYIAVAYYDATDGRVGVPSLPVFVQVENAVTVPPTTTTASTSTTTTPSTTTAATTTPTTTTTTTTISTTTVEVTTTKGASTATLAFSCVVVAALAMLS
nr:uncharacterized protein LOC123746061 [Procambarus clarkii]